MNHIIRIYFLNYLAILTLLLVKQQTPCFSQTSNPGWKGSEIISASNFVNPANWYCGYQNNTGDSSYVTTDDSCLYIHWKFGTGNRYRYAQVFQVLNPAISLENKSIFGFDIKGADKNIYRNFQFKFEDGTHQSMRRWDGLAAVNRWCESISALKQEFSNWEQLQWNAVKVISFEINSEASTQDILPDSGVVIIKYLKTDSPSSWNRAISFESIKDSSVLSEIKNKALSALLGRQDRNTGLFYTWLTNKYAYLYGQGLLLKILSMEGKWENSEPADTIAMAAERLALFLAGNQNKIGYWPRAWNATNGDIVQNVEDDGSVWMGDFPWMIIGLQNYYNKSGDIRVKAALGKARNFLYNLIDENGKFYTLKPSTKERVEVTSGEAYAAAILSVYEMGDSAKANKMLDYIDSKTWNNDIRYWKESFYSNRIVLFANTWLSPFYRNTTNAQKALDALSFVGKALYTRGPGNPYGMDGIGPVAVWYEGSLSYICAGGPGSDSLFYNLMDYRYPDGTIPHYNDSVTAAGVWSVKWSSLDGTSWLYFAATRQSPFYRGTELRKEDEPKKVFIHTMGWYNEGENGQHWINGHAHTPKIGLYNSKSWALQLYQLLLSRSCGIDGMIMNVNMKDNYDLQSVSGMLSSINRINDIDSVHFKYDLAISYDDQGMDRSKPFDTASACFEYLKNTLLPGTGNYLYYYDRPAIFVYNYSNPKYLTAYDYNKTLNTVFGNIPPVICWNQIEADAINYTNASYPWVGPDNTGWDTINGLNWGKKYLEWYYPQANYYGFSQDFVIGGVWPGFDGRQCDWDGKRWMDRQNGKVYDSTWNFVNNYSNTLPLNWVVIETWNDWNEGTEIEPSKEYRYQYLKATIDNINKFKNSIITADTCLFASAEKIYRAGWFIEKSVLDSATCYPVLAEAISAFLIGNCTLANDKASQIINLVDVKSKLQAEGIRIYPVPAKNSVEISLNQPDAQISKIEIYNNQGILLATERNYKCTNTVTLHLNRYPSGVYILKIVDHHNNYGCKIIKE